jgi:hypothetical protein
MAIKIPESPINFEGFGPLVLHVKQKVVMAVRSKVTNFVM